MLKRILLLSLVVTISACNTNKIKDEPEAVVFKERDIKFSELENDLLNQKPKPKPQKPQLQTFDPIPDDKYGARKDDRVFFELNSAILTSDSQAVLDRQIAWLKNHTKSKIIVEGHTDERGTREYNLALGDRRSNAVRSYLISSGIERNRVITVSYGKERPVEFKPTSTALAMNRRAVTIIRDK